MSKELKQCPFCGGDPELQFREKLIRNNFEKFVTIKCSMCGAGTKLFQNKNLDKAKTAWNRRVTI